VAFILSQPVEPLSHAVPPSHLPSHPLDVTQAFGLIDRILPFEACLYHEIIPLFLENRTLHLGMVTLTDVPALDYARKILLFLNYTLIPQIISTDLHRQVLSQYLQFKGQADPCIEDQTIFYEAEECAPLQPLRSATVRASSPSKIPPSPPIDRETLIVETPEAIDDWLMDLVKPAARSVVEPAVKEVLRPIDRWAINDLTLIQSSNDRGHLPTPVLAVPVLAIPDLLIPALPTPGDALPILAVKTTYADASPEILQGLDSTELLENLLGRVLTSGIGRLYFEDQSDSGRVLSSTNGILQSLIESFPIARFESLIWALKNLMKVSPEPVTEPLQVEIERCHEKNRLLLRLRLMPKWEDNEVVGEEATLQILRGAALRFYQQQQRTHLRRDTFLVAKNLQQKVQALQERSNPAINHLVTPISDSQP
jgi:Type II secretion system (T2SS), protein E, N-terminal domain